MQEASELNIISHYDFKSNREDKQDKNEEDLQSEDNKAEYMAVNDEISDISEMIN